MGSRARGCGARLKLIVQLVPQGLGPILTRAKGFRVFRLVYVSFAHGSNSLRVLASAPQKVYTFRGQHETARESRTKTKHGTHRLPWKCTDPCSKTAFLLEMGFVHKPTLVGGRVLPFRGLTDVQASTICTGSTEATITRRITEPTKPAMPFLRSWFAPFLVDVPVVTPTKLALFVTCFQLQEFPFKAKRGKNKYS